MIKHPNLSLELIDAWYLNCCASRHICKNRDLFSDLQSKNFEFITVGGELIWFREVGTVQLSLQSRKMTLLNIAYIPKYDSNLISLGQLRESRILYHDHPDSIILKQGGSHIGLAMRNKNLFILETKSEKAMLVRGRDRPTYLLSPDLQTRLWHRRLGHASNARVAQASKLVDGINLGEASRQIDESYSSDSELNNNSDKDIDTCTPIHKTTEQISEEVEELCKAYIENKYTRIVKSKKMTPTTKRLQKVHADLWGPHELASISGKSYIGLLLNKYTWKSWILLLRSKDEFFNTFKLWLPRAETCGSRLDCLRTDGGGEFISTAFQSFCQERGINIGYAVPYIHEENGIAERCWRTLTQMKDSLLIDSGLPTQFWAEAMDTANYLQNRLSTRRTKTVIISEET